MILLYAIAVSIYYMKMLFGNKPLNVWTISFLFVGLIFFNGQPIIAADFILCSLWGVIVGWQSAEKLLELENKYRH